MRFTESFLRLGFFVGALAVTACSGKDDERPQTVDRTTGPTVPIPYERLPEPTAAFQAQQCRRKVSGYATECGQVTVAAAPGSSETLRIDVVRIFSKAEAPAADPIVYLEGGPGYPGSAGVLGAFEAFEPFIANRDLVVIDQRGTGRTGAALACSELAETAPDGDLVDGLAQCSTRLRSEGVDLSWYSTSAGAADVDAVRRAFGYPEWNLLGISYGTRLGLTVLRDFPEGVRSAVLDSVVPLQVDFIAQLAPNGLGAFEAVYAACAAEAECGLRYPEPLEQLKRVVLHLNETPVQVDGFAFTGDDFLNLLFSLIYHPAGVALVPWLVDQVDQGDTARLELLVEALYGDESGSPGISFGMHLSVQCAEEVAFTTREAVADVEAAVPEELVGGLSGQYYFDYCDAWQVPAAAARENEAVRSSVPSLVMAGGFDPITPPHYAELVHGDLEGSLFVTLDNLSHGASIDPCGYSLVNQFYEDPGGPLALGCVGTVPPPEFESAAPPRRLGAAGRTLRFAVDNPTDDELRGAIEAVSRQRVLFRRGKD